MRRWIKNLSLMLMMSVVSLEASRGGCRTVEQGPPGPAGPTGAAGPTGPAGRLGGSDHLFAYSTVLETITPGSAVSFPSGLLTSGTSIMQSALNTITINATGDYLVNFVCYYNVPAGATPAIQTPGFQCRLNGSTLVGTNAPSSLPNNVASVNPITVTGVISEIIHISSAPTTLQVVNVDPTNTLTLGFGTAAATIDIVQLTTP